MVDWVKYNVETLSKHDLVCTGTTGMLIQNVFNELSYDDVKIECMNSGPLGGDAEIAAEVVQGKINLCIFLMDDLSPQPHESDIQMLLRQCRVHNIPVACNRYTADLIMTSTLWDEEDYIPKKPIYTKFNR
jgi:methylglyoxal synthase